MNPSTFPNLNNPPPDSILGSKFLNADYLLSEILKFFKFIFRKEILTDLNTIFLFLSFFFLTIIFYSAVRLFEIRRKEKHHLELEIQEYAHRQAELEKKKREGESVSHNERWRKVLEYLFSSTQENWKLAVIEADSMLEALLDQLGFKGEGLGEKLKAASQGNFHGASMAWEAHAVRNMIAHEGSVFELSEHEAKRVIALYEGIFRQYGYI